MLEVNMKISPLQIGSIEREPKKSVLIIIIYPLISTIVYRARFHITIKLSFRRKDAIKRNRAYHIKERQ